MFLLSNPQNFPKIQISYIMLTTQPGWGGRGGLNHLWGASSRLSFQRHSPFLLRQIHFAIRYKYILQFETNTLCNLRQLNHLWGDSSQLRFLETLHLHLQNVVLPISFVSPQILLSTFTEYFHVNICKCYRQTCLCLFWFSGLLPSTSASSLYSYNLPTFCDLRLCWVWFIAVCFWISLWNS